MEDLNSHFEKILPLKTLADKIKIQTVHLVVVIIILAILLSTSQLIGNFVVIVMGIAYPALVSLADIHGQEIDDRQWLTYWVLFSATNFFDYFTGNVLSWIPFYYTFKLLFIVYLFFPSTKGGLAIYEKFILPIIIRYEGEERRSKLSRDSRSKSD